MSTTIDLTPPRVDLRFISGQSVQFDLTVVDSDGDPVTITGTVTAKAKTSHTATEAVAFTATASGNVVTLSIADTSAIEGAYVWDCYWVDGAAYLAYGSILASPPSISHD